MPAPKPLDLMEETEKLIAGMVRDARKRRRVTDPETGKVRVLVSDITERAKAAQAALNFLAAKHKLEPPEKEETEFERQQREFYNEGEGSADRGAQAGHAD